MDCTFTRTRFAYMGDWIALVSDDIMAVVGAIVPWCLSQIYIDLMGAMSRSRSMARPESGKESLANCTQGAVIEPFDPLTITWVRTFPPRMFAAILRRPRTDRRWRNPTRQIAASPSPSTRQTGDTVYSSSLPASEKKRKRKFTESSQSLRFPKGYL